MTIHPEAPLHAADVLLADLDGVVYRGHLAVPHAVDSLEAVAREGIHVGYVTNNASRTPDDVARQLRGFGLSAQGSDIVTSPQAGVKLLRELVPAGATVLVVGGDGLIAEVQAAGYTVTSKADDEPAGVIQGFHPSVGWTQLAEASYAIQRYSIPWVATNQDWTIPRAEGIAPGNGTLVSAVHTAVGVLPTVAGKPERAIFDAAVARFGAQSAFVVGDRLDTDILGANRAGLESALVLTGIDQGKQLIAAKPEERPTYILDDLRQLLEPYPWPELEEETSTVYVRDAAVRLVGNRVEIVNAGSNPTDLLRAGCGVVWASGLAIYALEVPRELYER